MTLTGKVADKENGSPIPGAVVRVPDLMVGAVTDGEGRYALPGLPANKVMVTVSMAGYGGLTETIDLATTTIQDFFLLMSVTEMGELVVTGSSRATELRREPVPVVVIDRSFLRGNSSTNAIATLAKVPGVSVVGSGPNVSKPYIRGLGGNRVVTLFNGVRQEGQQWGEEHGIEVDQFLVDRVELVKGPASLMYGSDALAGVLNLMSAPPVPAGFLNGEVLAGYDGNNKGLVTSAHVDGNDGKLLYGGRLSGKMAGNYQNRFDGRVYGTKYAEQDLSAYLGLNRPWGSLRVHASLYDARQEIPEGSRDSTTRRFTYPADEEGALMVVAPDDVLNSYVIGTLHQRVQYYRAYATTNINHGANRVAAIFGAQRSVRREYSHPEHGGVPGLYLILNSMPFDLKYHLAERAGWQWSFGVNGMVQANEAGRGTELVIPDHTQFDIGPFVHVRRDLGKWDLSGGLRHDLRHFRSKAMYMGIDPATGLEMVVPPSDDSTVTKYFDPYEHVFQGTSGSMGAAWNPHERVTLKMNLGRGYRAPVAAESTAHGIHPGTGLMQLGNPDLLPEFSLQEDVGLFYTDTHVSARLEVFHNTVSNYIYNERLASVLGGDSLYVQDGDEYPVFKFRQTKAVLYGGEMSVDIHPHPWDQLHFENSLSVVYAENRGGDGAAITDSTRYLPLIPPLRWASELRYDMAQGIGRFSGLFVRAGVQVFAAQNRYFEAFGTETRTPGYWLLDAGVGGDLMAKDGRVLCSFTVQATNLLDRAYQSNMSRLKYLEDHPHNHTGRSGIYEMGRNISVSVMVPFSVKPKRRKDAAPTG